MSEENTQEQEFHFFCSTVYGWSAKADLWAALSALKKSGGPREGTAKKGTEYTVYKVPGKSTGAYRILYYAPQVEGTEFIFKGVF